MRRGMLFIQSKPFTVAAVVLLVISIITLQFPLLNYLGYEFSVVIALTIPWIIWLPVRMLFRAWVESGNSKGFGMMASSALISGVGILAVPLSIASANALFVKNCAITEGVLYFLLLPVVTCVWLTSLALWCCVMCKRPLRTYVVSLMIVLCYPLYLGYASPQIFSYNFVYGYFPGISYDEVMRITSTLVLFRGVTILCAVLLIGIAGFVTKQGYLQISFLQKLLFMVRPRRPFGVWISVLVLLTFQLLMWIARVSLGFESSPESIQHTLSSNIRTEHFIIYYAPHSFSDEEVEWVAADHELYYSQVKAALQVNGVEVITSYIYPDAGAKREAIGTATTNIAKPWRKEIHLDKDSWQETLKHEIVHVMAGEFGMPVIRAHYHIGLVEGLAMAVDGEYGNRTLHEYASAVRRFDLLRDPVRLITPIGFATHASSLSYVLMGSFCQYLIDRYGIVRMKEVYGGRSVERVYGKSYALLADEWKSFLERTEVPDAWQDHVEYYFKRPSIFAKECVRTIALLNDNGYRNIENNSPIGAMRDFSRALTTSWNTESYAGLVRSAYNAEQYDTLLQLMNAATRDSLHWSSFSNLLIIYGDALWHTGNVEVAREAYRRVMSLDLSHRFNEAAAIRLTAMTDPVLVTLFPKYLAKARSDSTASLVINSLSHHSSHPIISYLRAKIDFRKKNLSRCIDILQKDTTKFTLPVLNAGKEQLLAQAHFLQREYQQARMHFWASLNYVDNHASIGRIENWINRCEWYEQYGKQYLTH